MKIKYAYTGPRIVLNPDNVHGAHVLGSDGLVELVLQAQKDREKNEEKPDKKTIRLKDFLEAAPAGGLATGSLKMFQLGNTTSKTDLVKFFADNNFVPGSADSLADSVLDTVRSVAGKAAFIGVAGGAAAYGILEVIKPAWSWKKRLLWSLVTALVIAVVYLILWQAGVMK